MLSSNKNNVEAYKSLEQLFKHNPAIKNTLQSVSSDDIAFVNSKSLNNLNSKLKAKIDNQRTKKNKVNPTKPKL